MAEPTPVPRAVLAWLPWLGGAVIATFAGIALALWGVRGGAMILDLVAAYCF